jgi:hypothetical protein
LSVNFVGYCLSLFFAGHLADRCGLKTLTHFFPLLLVRLS